MPRLLRDAAWPTIELAAGVMVGVVDIGLVGNFDPDPVAGTAAVGSAGLVMWLILVLAQGVGVGVVAELGRQIGAGNAAGRDAAILAGRHLARRSAGIWFCIQAAAAAALMVAMRGDPATASRALTYLLVTALAIPAVSLTQTVVAEFRARGDMRSPLLLVLATNGINAGVSILLAMALAPLGNAFLGVALGTLIAHLATARLALRLAGTPPAAADTPEMRRRMGTLAWPAIVDGLLVWAGQAGVFAYVLMSQGAAGVAAHSTGLRLVAMLGIPTMALAIATAPAVSRMNGAAGPQAARRLGMQAVLGGAMLALPLAVAMHAWGEGMARLLIDDPEVAGTAGQLLAIISWTHVAYAIHLIAGRACQGLGDTRGTMRMNLLSVTLVLLPIAVWAGEGLGWGLFGVWAAYCCERTVNAGLFLARLHGWSCRIGWTMPADRRAVLAIP